MGLNTVGGCDCRCGSCSGCCNGDPPDEWLATFAFEDAFPGLDCTSCVDFLSGEYVLTKSDDGYCTDDDCCWSYIWEGTHVPDCDEYTITKVEILLKVRCQSACFADAFGGGSEAYLFWFAFHGYYNDTPAIPRATIFVWAYGITEAPYYHRPLGDCEGFNSSAAELMGILFPAENLHGACKGGVGFNMPFAALARV